MWNFDAHQRAGPNPHFLPPTEDASQTVPSVLCTVLWTVLLTVLLPSGFDFLTSGTTHAQSFSMDKLSSCILILNSKVFSINSICFFHILFGPGDRRNKTDLKYPNSPHQVPQLLRPIQYSVPVSSSTPKPTLTTFTFFMVRKCRSNFIFVVLNLQSIPRGCASCCSSRWIFRRCKTQTSKSQPLCKLKCQTKCDSNIQMPLKLIFKTYQ